MKNAVVLTTKTLGVVENNHPEYNNYSFNIIDY
jgi:hypothetical protein